MNLEANELAHVARSVIRPGIRWSSVFAGTCVGIAVYVLAMLLGICVGLASAGGASGDASVAALGWNLISALAAAMLGTFVAARSADLRRAADGAMHGLVVWGCAALLVTLVALSLVRDVAGNVVLLMAQSAGRETALAQIDRDSTWEGGVRQTAFGAITGPDDRPRAARMDGGVWPIAAPAPIPPAKSGIDIPAYAALMMCAALAISLFGSIAGGLLGTRTPRRNEPTDQADWAAIIDDIR